MVVWCADILVLYTSNTKELITDFRRRTSDLQRGRPAATSCVCTWTQTCSVSFFCVV